MDTLDEIGPDTTLAPGPPDPDEARALLEELTRLRAELAAGEGAFASMLRDLSDPARQSARNLIHYVGLRRRDLRDLQGTLARHGLSSLGRSEPHVLANVDAVLAMLRRALGRPPEDEPREAGEPAVDFSASAALREERTNALLGPRPARRRVRVMVTAPTAAADDYGLVRDLVAGGMDCLRINCAHDGPAQWERMVANARRAAAELERPCRVLMDIAGPKLRTGPVEPGPQVVKLKPERDPLGWVTRPTRVWLAPEGDPAAPPSPADAVIPLPDAFLARLRPGDALAFRDARGARRRLHVVGVEGAGRWARGVATAYVGAGTRMVLRRGARGGGRRAYVGALPPREQKIPLDRGDLLVLTRDGVPGRAAVLDADRRVRMPARISVSHPEAVAEVRTGERVWFDEGRIGGVIRAVADDGIHVEITHVRAGGDRLRAAKGINLPDSVLRFPPLTPEDVEALPFIVRHADLVGYSFVRTAADVRSLQARLSELGGGGLGIVIKVETQGTFQALPLILLEAMRYPVAGVMIARGDLAVECGFERLAEVQEEILWLCEAAHLPVVWATQVLEQLTREGMPSRAEVTDAATAERAECVMLNKGAYVVEAVRVLDDILRRMASHQEKKRALMRHLRVADHFFESAPG